MGDVSKSGFTVIELVVVISVVGLLAFLGYTFYTQQQHKVADTVTEVPSPTIATVPPAPIINTATDLTLAEKALDSTASANSNDSAQLDSEFANF
jgi:prepilin-type N-terminal cleavage/methylation domain-containing protein